MRKIDHRRFKDELYAEFARAAEAIASPKRLEMLDLLAHRERSVEDLAGEMQLSTANASRHLQVLLRARLVEVRRAGTFAHYRLASPKVYAFLRGLESVAADRLPEVGAVLERHLAERPMADLSPVELLRRMRERRAVLIDVRPEEEFAAGHIAGARSVPLEGLAKRQGAEALPRDREIIVYCRGTYCVWADEAVELLRRRGFVAHRLSLGPPDWAALGQKLQAAG
jgi:rhodanese-related sulfurtransferase/DNA-binding transcriptional ArsR family regulator